MAGQQSPAEDLAAQLLIFGPFMYWSLQREIELFSSSIILKNCDLSWINIL